eukprot:326324-Pyramimonas_sp.AAC.1
MVEKLSAQFDSPSADSQQQHSSNVSNDASESRDAVGGQAEMDIDQGGDGDEDEDMECSDTEGEARERMFLDDMVQSVASVYRLLETHEGQSEDRALFLHLGVHVDRRGPSRCGVREAR